MRTLPIGAILNRPRLIEQRVGERPRIVCSQKSQKFGPSVSENESFRINK